MKVYISLTLGLEGGLAFVLNERGRFFQNMCLVKSFSKIFLGAADSSGISASGALAYDGVYVMEAAFKSLLQQKPNIFRHNVRRGELVRSFG